MIAAEGQLSRFFEPIADFLLVLDPGQPHADPVRQLGQHLRLLDASDVRAALQTLRGGTQHLRGQFFSFIDRFGLVQDFEPALEIQSQPYAVDDVRTCPSDYAESDHNDRQERNQSLCMHVFRPLPHSDLANIPIIPTVSRPVKKQKNRLIRPVSAKCTIFSISDPGTSRRFCRRITSSSS